MLYCSMFVFINELLFNSSITRLHHVSVRSVKIVSYVVSNFFAKSKNVHIIEYMYKKHLSKWFIVQFSIKIFRYYTPIYSWHYTSCNCHVVHYTKYTYCVNYANWMCFTWHSLRLAKSTKKHKILFIGNGIIVTVDKVQQCERCIHVLSSY